MTTENEVVPVNAALYPDVAEHGGLAAALVATGDGVNLGEIGAGGRLQNVAATLTSDRGRVAVTLIVNRRVFSIRIIVDGRDWATGGASSLAEVVDVSGAWHGGATLAQLDQAFPFMRIEPFALGYESGDPLGAYWEWYLHDPELTVLRPLLQAAHRHPRLSKLFPGVSHLTLAQFRLDDHNRESGVIQVEARRDGTYRIDSSLTDEEHTAASIDAAIALAAAQLPAPPSSQESN